MIDKSACVITTSTYYPNGTADPRFPLALATAEAVCDAGYRFVVVDESPSPFVTRELEARGAEVLTAEQPGMGPCRRQAIRNGMKGVGYGGAGCFIEPEKAGMARCLDACFAPIFGGADIVVSCRSQYSWKSYPANQRLSEPFGTHGFALATGRGDLDMFHGPRFFNWRGHELFLQTRPDVPGDNSWGATHYPVIQAIALKLAVVGVMVDYFHPDDQKRDEGYAIHYRKRVKQLAELGDGTFMYAMALGVMARDEALIRDLAEMYPGEVERLGLNPKATVSQ